MAQILPQDHTKLDFFFWFPMMYVKTSKNYDFLAQLVQKWGPHGPRPKQKTIFLSEIIKPDSKLPKTFYLNKIPYVLAELWMFFYIV